MNCLFDVHLMKDDYKKTHKNMYIQRLHVNNFFLKLLNSIKLFSLCSTEISSTEYRDVHYRVPKCPVPSTEMSRSRDVLIP